MPRYSQPIPLYGVPIQDAIATGDRDLMQAMAKVSEFLLRDTKAGGAELEQWQAAHGALKKALG